MSIRLMNSVFDLPIPPRHKLLLLTLADCASDDGSSIYPSIAYMARRSTIPTRSIQRYLDELRKSKVLIVVKEEQYHRAIEYRMNIAAIHEWLANQGRQSLAGHKSRDANSDKQGRQMEQTATPPNGVLSLRDPLREPSFLENSVKDYNMAEEVDADPIAAQQPSLPIGAVEAPSKGKRKKGVPDPRLKAVMTLWRDCYREHKGFDYPSSWGRDMKAIQRVMTPSLSLEAIAAAMRKFFHDTNDWHYKQRGAKLEVFLDRLPVLLEGQVAQKPKTAKELGYRFLSDIQGD